MNEIIQFFIDNYILIIGIPILIIVINFIDIDIKIGKLSYSLMEWFFGITIICGVFWILYYNFK